MNLIDIGVNFHSSQLINHTAELLQRAKAAGLAAILATGTTYASSLKARDLAAEERGFVFSTAGVHPHSADAWASKDEARFAELWSSSDVVAVGECGLDYNRNFSTRENQRRAFSAQLRAAVGVGKPVFLHCRDAFDEFVELLTEPDVAGVHGVVHCFTGDGKEADALLDLDLDIGITGWVTDLSRGIALREAVARIPLERIHLETDAPYLAPKNLKRRRPFNEPANLPAVAQAVADIKGLPVEDVAEQCTQNSRRLFSLSYTAP